MTKTWTTPGGIHPPENKRQSLTDSIGTLPLAAHFILPIQQHTKTIVSVGQVVLKGQALTEISGFMGVVSHAPSSGTVSAISDKAIPHPSGLAAPCITIQADGFDNSVDFTRADASQLSSTQILKKIRNAGIMGMGGGGFPTAIKTAPNPNKPIHTLIINAAECEPYITADEMLMRCRPQHVIAGIEILAQLLGNPTDIFIGIESNKLDAISALQPLLAGTSIKLVEFPPKYPSGGEKQLIQILTGQEVPSGKLPSELGILCQNVGTTVAIFKAVSLGEPLISRVTTVSGEACAIQRNFDVPIGTPVVHLLQHCGFDQQHCDRVIMGGPMMGFTLPDIDVPVVKTSNCILAPKPEELPSNDIPQACIRCGLCAEACPASLLPQQLLWYAQSKNHERIQAHNLFDCIECGACSFVCPSKIPLVQYYRAAKGEIRQLAHDKTQSDRARARFEYNKLRKEKQEQEKIAKREQRRIAAEKAKTDLNGKSNQSVSTGASDIVQAALARVADQQASPAQQTAKLHRAVQSCAARLARGQQKLVDAAHESSDKRAALQSLVDTAQMKLHEAQQKLSADQSPDTSATNASKSTAVAPKTPASPRSTLERKIGSINDKIANIEDKMTQCDDAGLIAVLTSSRHKFIDKLNNAQAELKALESDAGQAASDPASLSATDRAMAQAKSRLQANTEAVTTDPGERLRSRLTKARQRLAAAEQNNSEQAPALRNSVERLEQKLAELEQ